MQNLIANSDVDRPSVQNAQALKPTRRSFLMNTLVSLPIVAAMPTAAPAMPVDQLKDAFEASNRSNTVADAELIALVDQYVVAEQRYCDLNRKADLIEGESNHRRNPVPEILSWRASDAELGLPSLWSDPKDHPPVWDRPIDVNRIRDAEWTVVSKYAIEGECSITLRDVTPSAAARARADEIIAAFDKWHEDAKPPRGYKKAVRERDKAYRASNRLEAQIAETPATTLEGMRAKIRCAQAFECDDDIQNIDSGGATEAMALSIFKDVLRLTSAKA
jgi:hypothetical protein